MIRADFLYRVKTNRLNDMMAKFKASGDPKFQSTPSNIKMEMAFREEQDDTIISLNIYYYSLADYEARTAFERSQDDWLAIWFKEDDIFTYEPVQIFQLD